MKTKIDLFDIEMAEFTPVIETIKDYYGFDMSGYGSASLRRRFIRLMEQFNYDSVFELNHAIINQEISYQKIVNYMTVNVTEMFRFPPFFRSLKDEVIPYLKTFPVFKIWHAGCSTGEEMYSLAILLHEAGILHRAKIYGSDINSEVLEIAKQGIYKMNNLKEFTKNYQESGGTEPFSSYYTANYDMIKMDPMLSEQMTFCTHNLVHDGPFNEFQLILCRNVLIYFDIDQKTKIISLFDKSLCPTGYVGLGSKDRMITNGDDLEYSTVNQLTKIYRKETIGIRA